MWTNARDFYVEAKIPSAEIDILVSYTYNVVLSGLQSFLGRILSLFFGCKYLHLVSDNLWAAILTVCVAQYILRACRSEICFFSLFFQS